MRRWASGPHLHQANLAQDAQVAGHGWLRQRWQAGHRSPAGRAPPARTSSRARRLGSATASKTSTTLYYITHI